MASLTRWTWVWVNSGRWWWTGRPGMLRFMGSQRVGHDWATELNWLKVCPLCWTVYPWKWKKVLVAQLCLTLYDPMDCRLPSSSVHGILQARMLEWIAIPFSKGAFQPRDWTWVFCIADRFFTVGYQGISLLTQNIRSSFFAYLFSWTHFWS